MAIILQMKKPVCKQVTQRDLAEYRLFAKDIRMIRMQIREKREGIMAKLLAGAEVEDGISEAEVVTITRGEKSFVRLVVR